MNETNKNSDNKKLVNKVDFIIKSYKEKEHVQNTHESDEDSAIEDESKINCTQIKNMRKYWETINDSEDEEEDDLWQ